MIKSVSVLVVYLLSLVFAVAAIVMSVLRHDNDGYFGRLLYPPDQ